VEKLIKFNWYNLQTYFPWGLHCITVYISWGHITSVLTIMYVIAIINENLLGTQNRVLKWFSINPPRVTLQNLIWMWFIQIGFIHLNLYISWALIISTATEVLPSRKIVSELTDLDESFFLWYSPGIGQIDGCRSLSNFNEKTDMVVCLGRLPLIQNFVGCLSISKIVSLHRINVFWNME